MISRKRGKNPIRVTWNLNKRTMDHSAHLRKQFKTINTYDYIITMIKTIKKNIINFLRIEWFFINLNSNTLHPRMLCSKVG